MAFGGVQGIYLRWLTVPPEGEGGTVHTYMYTYVYACSTYTYSALVHVNGHCVYTMCIYNVHTYIHVHCTCRRIPIHTQTINSKDSVFFAKNTILHCIICMNPPAPTQNPVWIPSLDVVIIYMYVHVHVSCTYVYVHVCTVHVQCMSMYILGQT